jgi:hypothetical protein
MFIVRLLDRVLALQRNAATARIRQALGSEHSDRNDQ